MAGRWTGGRKGILAVVALAVAGGGWFVAKPGESVGESDPAGRAERDDRSDDPPSGKHRRERDAPATLADEIRRLVATAKPPGRGELGNERLAELLRRLAEIDPREAIDLAEKHAHLHGRPELAAEIFAGWSDRESAALRWFDALPPGDLRQRLVPVRVASLASDQPEEALALAGELPGYEGGDEGLPEVGRWDDGDEFDGQLREQAYAKIFREWAVSDPVAAAARAAALEHPVWRNLALQEVAAKWMLKDPAAALEWARNLAAVPDRQSALEGVMAEWAGHDPAAAAEFLTGLEAGPQRSHWQELLGERWAATEPAAALEWAEALDDDAGKATLVRTMLARVMESDSREAADFAIGLNDPAARKEGMELVLSHWAATDAEGLAGWLESLPEGVAGDEARAILSAE
jgi:hypothetical protein